MKAFFSTNISSCLCFKGAGVNVWWLAVRPFAFPASTMPVLLGSTTAVMSGGATFKPFYFLLALIGIMLLHAGSNLFQDAHDFERGLDREVLPLSGAVVRGLISPAEAKQGGIMCLLLAGVIGVYLTVSISLWILPIGLVGAAIGYFYSSPPLGLKYRALGDLSVFLNFGLLGTLGAWLVQSGFLSWLPVVWAVPIALLVVGILHANNWRDIDRDTSQGYQTVAAWLSDRRSALYYFFLLLLPYFIVFILVLARWIGPMAVALPPACLCVFLSLPIAISTYRMGLRRDLTTLDGASAKLNLIFGLLYVAGFILDFYLPIQGS